VTRLSPKVSQTRYCKRFCSLDLEAVHSIADDWIKGSPDLDPVYAAIERHKEACAAFNAECGKLDEIEGEATREAVAPYNAASEAEHARAGLSDRRGWPTPLSGNHDLRRDVDRGHLAGMSADNLWKEYHMPNKFDLDAELDRIVPGPTANSSEDRTIASVSVVVWPDGATVSPDAELIVACGEAMAICASGGA
jgi:hypothetical protein